MGFPWVCFMLHCLAPPVYTMEANSTSLHRALFPVAVEQPDPKRVMKPQLRVCPVPENR